MIPREFESRFTHWCTHTDPRLHRGTSPDCHVLRYDIDVTTPALDLKAGTRLQYHAGGEFQSLHSAGTPSPQFFTPLFTPHGGGNANSSGDPRGTSGYDAGRRFLTGFRANVLGLDSRGGFRDVARLPRSGCERREVPRVRVLTSRPRTLRMLMGVLASSCTNLATFDVACEFGFTPMPRGRDTRDAANAHPVSRAGDPMRAPSRRLAWRHR